MNKILNVMNKICRTLSLITFNISFVIARLFSTLLHILCKFNRSNMSLKFLQKLAIAETPENVGFFKSYSKKS